MITLICIAVVAFVQGKLVNEHVRVARNNV